MPEADKSREPGDVCLIIISVCCMISWLLFVLVYVLLYDGLFCGHSVVMVLIVMVLIVMMCLFLTCFVLTCFASGVNIC